MIAEKPANAGFSATETSPSGPDGYRAVSMDEAEELREIESRFTEAGKRLLVMPEEDGTFTALCVSATVMGVGSSQTVPGYTASTRLEAARLAWTAFVASR